MDPISFCLKIFIVPKKQTNKSSKKGLKDKQWDENSIS